MTCPSDGTAVQLFPDVFAELDGTSLVDDRTFVVRERGPLLLDPQLPALRWNFIQRVAEAMRKPTVGCTSGVSPNFDLWVHICSVIGGGIGYNEWIALNDVEQQAALLAVNEHNKQLKEAADKQSQELTKQFASNTFNSSPLDRYPVRLNG